MKNEDPWDSLSIPGIGLNTIRIDKDHHLNFRRAKDSVGNYLGIFEFPANQGVISAPKLNNIEIEYHKIDDSNAALFFRLQKRELYSIFDSLLLDLMHSSINFHTGYMKVILARLLNWQKIMEKEKLEILPEEKIKGLFGELYFLFHSLTPVFGAARSIHFWTGPEGSAQDFEVNNMTIEVKTLSGSSSRNITISSENQLKQTLENLYLYTLTVSRSDKEKGTCLPEIIEKIMNGIPSEDMASVVLLNRLIAESGYFYHKAYFDFCYLSTDHECYSVKEGFPKIIPEDLKPGIRNVKYLLELKACSDFIGWPDFLHNSDI